jgi:AcrR family transcriptional regulator
MSNKRAPAVRKAAEDPRVARSTHALGSALVALLQARDFESITVQQVLDRAGVSRATFYAHYRNKVDVLHSSYESVLQWFDDRLEARTGDPRLFAVAEFLEHMHEMDGLIVSLRQAGQMGPMRELFISHAARSIEQRLAGQADESRRRLVARMLAGALAEAVDWWELHRDSVTPQQVDRAFHTLAAHVLSSPSPGTSGSGRATRSSA